MQCYETFGWSPEQLYQLSDTEASLLSIYFEEVAAHQYRQQKEMTGNTNKPSSATEIVEIELGDLDDDE